jgi:hypothetical protein
MPSIAGTRTPLNGDIPHDAFFQMTVPDAAEKFLTLVKKTKPTGEVAESLLKGGLKSAAKNFPSMINTVLSRESRFVKVNGEWGLSTWYPGMRKKSRALGEPAEAAAHPTEPKIKDKAGKTGMGFTPKSVKGRTQILLNSNPSKIYTAESAAEALQADVAAVRAALCGLVDVGLAKRVSRGQYQSD